ncbi:hypothetical protein CRG98_029801 [Punica granatum]|uniref:Uncharacterized protein n=1 Tax=Punica granatum TaxID=22663 RepID=A0A2I0J0S3_PUNGR|nr:hypothetical protein CRG98_029801 [Punica granatum]
MRGETVEVFASTGFNNLVAGRAKTESPPVLVLFDLDGAVDPLPMCFEPGTRNVVMAQQDLPHHAVSAGRTDLSVVLDDGDGVERVEGEVLIVPNTDVGDSRLLINSIVLLTFDRDESLFHDELKLLMQGGGNCAR